MKFVVTPGLHVLASESSWSFAFNDTVPPNVRKALSQPGHWGHHALAGVSHFLTSLGVLDTAQQQTGKLLEKYAGNEAAALLGDNPFVPFIDYPERVLAFGSGRYFVELLSSGFSISTVSEQGTDPRKAVALPPGKVECSLLAYHPTIVLSLMRAVHSESSRIDEEAPFFGLDSWMVSTARRLLADAAFVARPPCLTRKR